MCVAKYMGRVGSIVNRILQDCSSFFLLFFVVSGVNQSQLLLNTFGPARATSRFPGGDRRGVAEMSYRERGWSNLSNNSTVRHHIFAPVDFFIFGISCTKQDSFIDPRVEFYEGSSGGYYPGSSQPVKPLVFRTIFRSSLEIFHSSVLCTANYGCCSRCRFSLINLSYSTWFIVLHFIFRK